MNRRSFLKASGLLAGSALCGCAGNSVMRRSTGPLIAYVGTFSSPLHDVLPTQVDLPPGNGRGIHIFQVNRSTGALTPAGVYESGISPNCLAIDSTGTRLYATNETDRAGEGKEGTLSAFAINRADGQVNLLN